MRLALGFPSGAIPRVAAAAAWALLAIGGVVILERQAPGTAPRNPQATPPRASAIEDTVELHLTAGFRVSQWRVLTGTDEITPKHADAISWTGTIESSGSKTSLEIFVEAQPENFFSDHRHALQISLRSSGHHTERTIWSEGDVNVLINVEEWAGR